MSSENIDNEETEEFNFESKESSKEETSNLKTSNCENSEVSTPTKKISKISEARKLALTKARAARSLKAKERRESYQKLLIETSDEETEYIIKKVRRNTETVKESIESAPPPSPPPPPPPTPKNKHRFI